MPLSFIQSANFKEQQLVGTSIYKDAEEISIENTIENLAVFEYTSNSQDNAAIDGIKLNIRLQGTANTQNSVRYNGVFSLDKDVNQNYVFAVTVNNRIPNSQQLQAIRNNVSITEITDITRSQNSINILIDRLSIVNARYENGRRMSILNFNLKLPISESSISAPLLTRTFDALRFQINEANFYGVNPTLRVYDASDVGRTLSISFPSREIGFPISFAKRENVDSTISLDYSVDLSNASATFAMSRTINLQNYALAMTVNVSPLSIFLPDTLTVSEYSRTFTSERVYSPYEQAYFGISQPDPLIVTTTSFNNIYNRFISQYATCGFTLYRHNSIAGSAYIDNSSVIRCAYSIQVGLSNAPNNNNPNNPAEIFALRILDVDYANFIINDEKIRLEYRYANNGIISNVLSIRFSRNNTEQNASVRFYRNASNARELLADLSYAEGNFNYTTRISLLCDENTTIEQLKVLVERSMPQITLVVNNEYLFLSPLQFFTDNTYSMQLRFALGFWQLSGNSTSISANYFDGVFNIRPTNDTVSLEYLWTSNPTLGQVVNGIRNLNIRTQVGQSVPIFDFWISNKYYQVPESVTNKWRNLNYKKLFYKSQTRIFDLTQPSAITAVRNCFADIQELSSIDRIETVNTTATILPLTTTTANSTTLGLLGQNLTTQINRFISDYDNTFINVSRIEFSVADAIKNLTISNLSIPNVTASTSVTTPTFSGIVAIPLQSAYDDDRNFVINTTNPNVTDVYSIPVNLSANISDFVQTLQNNTIINSSIQTSIYNTALSNILIENLLAFNITNLTNSVAPSISYTTLRTNYFVLSNFATMRLLADQISLTLTSYLTAALATHEVATNALATPLTLNLTTTEIIDNTAISCTFNETQATDTISYEFDLNFALADRDDAADQNDDIRVSGPKIVGIQVALGGYSKDNTFFAYDAPNAFFEPSLNTLFPIEFVTEQADIAYILVRTRRLASDNTTVYSAVPNCYLGTVSFDSGLLQIAVYGTVPTNFEFTSVWTEDFGMPIVYAVPLKSYKNTLSITDRCNLDSIKLVLTNVPAGFDSVGFLAINKNNRNQTQKESKTAVTFGLVFDAIGAWDVLISPNAILSEKNDGVIGYDGRFYDRGILGSDEAYRMSFYNLPTNLAPMLSLSPVPNNSQVWVLRVSPLLRQYLVSQSDANNPTSLNGCFVSIDIKIEGLYSQVSSVVRVKIYRDYTCVYDVGLCDSYWNLVDPPKLSAEARQTVENRINLRIQELIDCDSTYEQDTANLTLRQNLLVTAEAIPTFPNGNALLLIKTSYESTLQNVSLLSADNIRRLRYKDCTVVARNRILENIMNREFLYLPNNDVPLTDVSEIQNAISTQNSYLYMRPQFQFPPDDQNKDCGENEIIIVGFGYTFKNWRNTLRSDSVVLGFDYSFSLGIYSSPQLNLCTRYYYSIAKT